MAKLKILKTGEADIESTDIWRFCVHSDYPTQKVYSSGQTTLTIPAGNNSGTKTISHGLGYAPIVMAMFETMNGKFTKVFGESKVSKIIPVMQYLAVNPTYNTIIAWESYDIPGVRTTSYVSVNDKIRFISSPGNSGVLPSPLQANTDYYVNSIVTNQEFTISTTLGGGTLDITDGGGTYGDIFYNITNPRIEDIDLIYSIDKTDSSNHI